MKIALIDDEPICLDEISGLIDEFSTQHGCHIDIVPFTDAETFLAALPEGGFNAVFMDIYMDGMDGVAAAIKMRGLDRDTPLVFLTSSKDFMQDAFSLHAFEYVVKPAGRERIHKILSDILERLPAQDRYIEVVDGRKNVRVFLNEIASAVTDAHYLDISLLGGEKLHCRMTMAEFTERAGNDPRFLTVNKGIAVNAEYITGFEDNCCVLENGAKHPVRVRDRLAVEQAVRDYNFERIRGRQTRFAGRRKGGMKMDMDRFLSALPQFFVLLPSAASSYYVMKNQTRHSLPRTAILGAAVLLPYSVLASCLCAVFHLEANALFYPALVLFFFLYRYSVAASLPKCLAVYVGVCAVQSFPAQLAYAFDAYLHPASGAADFSVEAACFQLVLSCLVAAAFARPACHYFFRIVDSLGSPMIWYTTLAFSSVFLIFNILAVPQSYSTLHTGRMFFLFLFLEVCLLAVLTSIYLLFYHGTAVILEHMELKERTQLLEMQAHQYRTLQEHMRQTAKLRHDFRHSVRLLSSLAEKNDLNGIRAHLAGYGPALMENTPANYCANASINALFGYYHGMAVSAGIDLDWRIELPEPLPYTELDMVSLFGNLIENAIDGCRTVPKRERYFCLTTEIRHSSSLYIVSTNSFNGKTRKGKDGYHSTKHSGKGTGLAAIISAAEKYSGSVRASDNGKEFYVDAMLKI